MMKALKIEDINPIVRGANYFTVEKLRIPERYNYGYQIFYLIDGRAKCRINNDEFDVRDGDFALYGPGDQHSFINTDNKAVSAVTIYFSWFKVADECLATGNGNVYELSEDYWAKADPCVSVSSLPDIPFIMNIPQQERLHLEILLKEIGHSFRGASQVQALRTKSLMLDLIYNLSVLNTGKDKPPQHAVIKKFINYLEGNFSADIDRNTVSVALGVSPSYLTALLKAQLDTNFSEYLTRLRMEKAMEFIVYSNMTVKEIAFESGYKDFSYFVSRFKKFYGESPGAWRK